MKKVLKIPNLEVNTVELEEAALRALVGKNIARYRKAHGDTQAALGQKLSYSDKAVSKWERGEGLPDLYVLTQIAGLYGATVGELIGETKPELQRNPNMRLYIFLFSAALTFVLATVLLFAFEIAQVRFNTWLFLVYAAAITALEASIFSVLWWGLRWKLVSFSALVWIGGLTVFLTAPGLVAARVFLICGALEAFVVFFLLYRRSRRTGGSEPEREPTGRNSGRA